MSRQRCVTRWWRSAIGITPSWCSGRFCKEAIGCHSRVAAFPAMQPCRWLRAQLRFDDFPSRLIDIGGCVVGALLLLQQI